MPSQDWPLPTFKSYTSDLKVGGNTLINDLPTYIFCFCRCNFWGTYYI